MDIVRLMVAVDKNNYVSYVVLFAPVVAGFPKPYVHNGMKNVGSNPTWCTKNSICFK